MQWIEIPYGSPLYQTSLDLRNRILRLPLGLTLSAEDTAEEHEQRHFGLLHETTLLACLVIRPIDHETSRLRQMAVESHCQGQGLGKKLVESTEAHLYENGVCRIELHARVYAAEFYRKLGYTAVDGIFTEIGIPHIRMHKSLV